MKKITIIWGALTVLNVVSFAVVGAFWARLNAMNFSDPARAHSLEARYNSLSDICINITFYPWLVLTPIFLILLFIYVGARLFSKLTGEDKTERIP